MLVKKTWVKLESKVKIKKFVIMELIDKSAVIAKIEQLDEFWHLSKSPYGQAFIESLLSFLDDIDVKEVDLKEESYNIFKRNFSFLICSNEEAYKYAKHFFELGLKQYDNGKNDK